MPHCTARVPTASRDRETELPLQLRDPPFIGISVFERLLSQCCRGVDIELPLCDRGEAEAPESICASDPAVVLEVPTQRLLQLQTASGDGTCLEPPSKPPRTELAPRSRAFIS